MLDLIIVFGSLLLIFSVSFIALFFPAVLLAVARLIIVFDM